MSPIRARSPEYSRSPSRKRRVSRSPSPRSRNAKRSSIHRSVSPRSRKRNSPDLEKLREKGTARERESHRDRNRENETHKARERVRDREKEVHRERERDRERRSHGRDEEDRRRSRHESREKETQGRDKERSRRSPSPEERRHRRHNESPTDHHHHQVSGRSEENVNREESPTEDSLARMKAAEEALEAKQIDKVKPSFELSGKLAAESNKVRGITLLFNEPPDARKPTVRWRLYVFKNGEALNEPLYVHRQTCYLFGRERRIADIPTDHPSCSKQHAVIQYRIVDKEGSDGNISKKVCPYLMDLGSTNGTFLNDNRLDPQRYYELFEKDTIRFGNSSREYVILHENSVT